MERLTWEDIYKEFEYEIFRISDKIDEPLKIKTSIIQNILEFILEYKEIIEYLDFEGVNFAGMDVRNMDFSSAKNVDLYPQTVQGKSLFGTILNGNFTGKSFEGVDVRRTYFTEAKNVDLDPQTVRSYIKTYFKDYSNKKQN